MSRCVKFALLGLACSALAAHAAPPAPVKVDSSRVVIVNYGLTEIEVADFKRHLDFLLGRNVPVVKPAFARKGSFAFYVGRKPTDANASSLAELEALEEADDTSVAMERRTKDRAEAATAVRVPGLVEWKVLPSGVYIWGELRRGLYRFLEEEFGFEWPWKDEIWVKQQTRTLTIRKLEGRWVPPFRVRSIRARLNETFARWATHLQGGKDDAPPEGHAFTSWWFRFCDDYPDIFGQRPDGIRAPYGVPASAVKNAMAISKKKAQYIPMCPSSTTLVDRIIAEWEAHGAGPKLNFCENDARPWEYCRCAACMALDGTPITEFGGIAVGKDTYPNWRSDRYVSLANRLMERAVKINPNVVGGFYAYNISELPPTREHVPSNVVVGLVPTTYTVDYISACLDGWKKAGMKQFYYRPNIRFYWRVPFVPMGYEKYLFNIQKLFYDAGGCLGFNYDGNAASSYFEYVQCWYLYKFMSDPTKGFEHWEERFSRCFGGAAPEVKEYFAFWRAKWDAEAMPRLSQLGGIGFNERFYANLKQMYKEEDWTQNSALLDRGLARADLTAFERRMLQTLRDENEQSRLFFLAWTRRTKEDVAALIEFRRTHGRATIWGFEEKAFAGLLPESLGGGNAKVRSDVGKTVDPREEPVAPAADAVDISLDE